MRVTRLGADSRAPTTHRSRPGRAWSFQRKASHLLSGDHVGRVGDVPASDGAEEVMRSTESAVGSCARTMAGAVADRQDDRQPGKGTSPDAHGGLLSPQVSRGSVTIANIEFDRRVNSH